MRGYGHLSTSWTDRESGALDAVALMLGAPSRGRDGILAAGAGRNSSQGLRSGGRGFQVTDE